MKTKIMMIIVWLFVSTCHATPSLNELTLSLKLWLVDQQQTPTHFNVNQGALFANESLNSGGEIHYKQQGEKCIAYAPHRFYDKHTHTIAKALYAHCQVFLSNTKHRNDRDEHGELIDFGKYKPSASNAFILAYSEHVESFSIYQIHGYAKEKRKTPEGKKADAIISNGHAIPSKRTIAITACLNEQLDITAMVYGLDVKELGGTTNILASLAPKNSQFFHIELSRQLRERLVSNNQLFKLFNQCLIS